jgi:NitT/TauT family transport system ATP-binding protein
MTSRPGRIKQVLDIDLGSRTGGRTDGSQSDIDLRSTPEFVHHRHAVWSLLHDEVVRAQQLERAVRTVEKEVARVG